MLVATLRKVAARPLVLTAVAALQTALAYLISVGSAVALGPLLDRRPATAALLGGDDGLFIELGQRHHELGAIFATSALVALMVSSLVGWITAGTFLAAFQSHHAGAAELTAATVEKLGRMISVSLLGLLLRALPLGAAGLAWAWLRPELQGTFPSVLAAAAGCAVALAIPWAIVTVVVDYARADRARAVTAIKAALRLAWRRKLPTLRLALANSTLLIIAVAAGYTLSSLTARWGLLHLVATVAAGTLRAGVTAFGLTNAAAVRDGALRNG